MSNYVATTNMGLLLPIPGVDPGPDWASALNAALVQIDSHDHSTGSGVAITPSGLNINADLSFQGNNATLLRTTRFNVQGSQPAGATDLACLYAYGVDLYYRDASGNQVRLTQSGGVAGSPGSITNLTSPASATWVSASSTFVWQSNTNIAANLDARNVTLRNATASSYGLTLTPPAAMAADTTYTLPALPASTTSLVSIGTGGAMGLAAPDGATIALSGSTLGVPNGGITKPKLAALGQQVSSSCGSFNSASSSYVDVTNLTVTITTTGRPVFIGIVADGTTGLSSIQIADSSGSGTSVVGSIKIVQDSTDIAFHAINCAGASAPLVSGIPSSSFSHIYVPAAATYVYKIQTKVTTSNTNISFSNAKLIAYEL